MYSQFLRNINSVGTTDTNIQADFNSELGSTYQLMLSKLKNFRTYMQYTFTTGMNVMLLSSQVSQTIASITSTGTTATCTTSAAHGYTTSNIVAISGAAPAGYNGTYTITVTGTTTFTYTLASAIATAASNTQYYPYPPGEIDREGMVITVGSVNYPLSIISSEYLWEQKNAIIPQATQMPQFYFPRKDDFGIWPIPQTAYTGNMYYHYRDRNLSVVDYSAGTVTVTTNSQLITGSGTTFTPAMVGRWFTVTDTTAAGQGYWYRVTGYTSATVLTLYRPYAGTTSSGISYNIGETPEIPEEGHMTLVDGATAGFLAHYRKDTTGAVPFYNMFYTGDPGNAKREEGNSEIAGGLIGLINRYNDRDDSRIINRSLPMNPILSKQWSYSLSM